MSYCKEWNESEIKSTWNSAGALPNCSLPLGLQVPSICVNLSVNVWICTDFSEHPSETHSFVQSSQQQQDLGSIRKEHGCLASLACSGGLSVLMSFLVPSRSDSPTPSWLFRNMDD